LSAPLSVRNDFIFHNVTAGSYLVDVHCATYAFVPLRLDVIITEGKDTLSLQAWETYRGNDWDNKGEKLAVLDGDVLDARVLGAKAYFMERSKCEFTMDSLPPPATAEQSTWPWCDSASASFAWSLSTKL
jgi:O-acetylhomoserine/O-acetylserine sulfhydrylase